MFITNMRRKKNCKYLLKIHIAVFAVHSVMFYSLLPHGLQHARLLCPSPSPGDCSDSCSFHWWCHPTISSSVIPFSSYLQSFPASGSFPRSQLFGSGGQSIGASALASVLPMNIQGWFLLGLTGWISLQAYGCMFLCSIFTLTSPRVSFLLCACAIFPCVFLVRTHVMTFRAHRDNPGWLPHFEILNLIPYTKTLFFK